MYQGKRVSKQARFSAIYTMIMIGVFYSATVFALAGSFYMDAKEEESQVVRAEQITATMTKATMPELTEEELEETVQTLQAELVQYQAKPETYIVPAGGNLWKAAEEIYGDGSYYPYLMEINNLSSTEVYEGQELMIEYFDEFEKSEILSECIDKIKELDKPKARTVSSYSTNDTGNPEGSNYVGKFYITGYDPHCKHCCGKTNGITASGKEATFNHTIAADTSKYPFGTKLYIEGLGTFTVEDRGGGISGNHIDVAVPSHDAAYKITGNYNVYIVN